VKSKIKARPVPQSRAHLICSRYTNFHSHKLSVYAILCLKHLASMARTCSGRRIWSPKYQVIDRHTCTATSALVSHDLPRATKTCLALNRPLGVVLMRGGSSGTKPMAGRLENSSLDNHHQPPDDGWNDHGCRPLRNMN